MAKGIQMPDGSVYRIHEDGTTSLVSGPNGAPADESSSPISKSESTGLGSIFRSATSPGATAANPMAAMLTGPLGLAASYFSRNPQEARDAALLGAQGATQDWLDELGGVIAGNEPIARAMDQYGTPIGPRVTVGDMTKMAIRRGTHEAEDRNPILGPAARMGGDILSQLTLQRLGVPIASIPGQVGIGMASAAGRDETGNPNVIGQQMLEGGAWAGALSSAGHIAPELAQRVGSGLKSAGARGLAYVAGAPVKEAMSKEGAKVGSELIERGAAKMFSTGEGIREGAKLTRQQLAQQADNVLDAVDIALTKGTKTVVGKAGAGSSAVPGTGAFQWKHVKSEIDRNILNNPKLSQETRKAIGPLLDEVANTSAKDGGFRAAYELKSKLHALGAKANNNAVSETVGVIDDILTNELDDQMKKALSKSELVHYKDLRKGYDALSPVEKWGPNSVFEKGGALDAGAAAVGLLKQGPAGMVHGLVANQVRQRVPSALAVGAYKTGGALQSEVIQNLLAKPSLTLAEEAALRTWLGRQQPSGENSVSMGRIGMPEDIPPELFRKPKGPKKRQGRMVEVFKRRERMEEE